MLPLSWHFDFLDSHNLPVLQPSTIGNIFGRNWITWWHLAFEGWSLFLAWYYCSTYPRGVLLCKCILRGWLPATDWPSTTENQLQGIARSGLPIWLFHWQFSDFGTTFGILEYSCSSWRSRLSHWPCLGLLCLRRVLHWLDRGGLPTFSNSGPGFAFIWCRGWAPLILFYWPFRSFFVCWGWAPNIIHWPSGYRQQGLAPFFYQLLAWFLVLVAGVGSLFSHWPFYTTFQFCLAPRHWCNFVYNCHIFFIRTATTLFFTQLYPAPAGLGPWVWLLYNTAPSISFAFIGIWIHWTHQIIETFWVGFCTWALLCKTAARAPQKPTNWTPTWSQFQVHSHLSPAGLSSSLFLGLAVQGWGLQSTHGDCWSVNHAPRPTSASSRHGSYMGIGPMCAPARNRRHQGTKCSKEAWCVLTNAQSLVALRGTKANVWQFLTSRICTLPTRTCSLRDSLISPDPCRIINTTIWRKLPKGVWHVFPGIAEGSLSTSWMRFAFGPLLRIFRSPCYWRRIGVFLTPGAMGGILSIQVLRVNEKQGLQ